MIAAIVRDNKLHIIKTTERVRLHVEIGTYCGQRYDASDSPVLQVPDAAFSAESPRAQTAACPKCKAAAGA